MIENVVIREAVTEEERSLFWERLRAYFCRDIFPDPEDEDRPYFLGDDYRRTMESLRTRPAHPVHWLVFSRNGQDVGFALAAVFTGEDGKWYKVVTANGLSGYVSKNYVSLGVSAQTTANLNMRKGAGSNYSRVTTLSKGASLTIYSVSGNWAYVKSGRNSGYVSMNFVKIR